MIGLALRLLRLGGRPAWISAGLVAGGVAVATGLLCVALGALHGLDERESRTAWRAPASASDGSAVAQLRTRTDAVAGRSITEVNLVDPRPGAAPPPGLPRMPAPGEVWVSPAMNRLVASLPPEQLADRYPGAVTGVLGDGALQDPDELVAVVGRPAEDPVLVAPGSSDVVPVAGFDRPAPTDQQLEIYRQLTIVAAALVLFPAAGLVGASARLSATRRRERLATMRLLGASTSRITVVAVTEVTAASAIGAAAGVALEWAAAPALATIPLAGGGWFTDDVRPSPLVLLGVFAGVTVLATLSAVGGLRRVTVGPLGVVRRSGAQGVRAIRVLGLVGALVVFGVVSVAVHGTAVAVAGAVFATGVLALFGAVCLIGPLVVRAVGAVTARRASSPHRLLAGRRLLDDPRGAFRPVAGLTLAVFVAAFLAPLTAAIASAGGAPDDRVVVAVPTARASAVAAAVRPHLGPGAVLSVRADPGEDDSAVVPGDGDGGTALSSFSTLSVQVPRDDLDRVRTLLDRAVPGTLALTPADVDRQGATFAGDLGRGATVVLVATFLLAATASGTTSAARVLDHRHVLRLQRLAGTPLSVLDRARRAETLTPLVANGAIALVLGLLCASPFASAVGATGTGGLVVFGSLLVVGTLSVLGATAASRPLLASATEPGRERDR
ncbi:FtsX-like permease family protein [Pseudonocardia endophytica]|uniref:FtsX-like permease family protein n=1 Tax=Pseudonocardia endophytica TaxID=401976 RepID=A0A4R1HKJ7_PSEEN|nr:FtsX-like permease family protein [Pseudonocardia endophytica]TCK20089.1 FtsX-like permease family protein [Pseudonocardia endophytica]